MARVAASAPRGPPRPGTRQNGRASPPNPRPERAFTPLHLLRPAPSLGVPSRVTTGCIHLQRPNPRGKLDRVGLRAFLLFTIYFLSDYDLSLKATRSGVDSGHRNNEGGNEVRALFLRSHAAATTAQGSISRLFFLIIVMGFYLSGVTDIYLLVVLCVHFDIPISQDRAQSW